MEIKLNKKQLVTASLSVLSLLVMSTTKVEAHHGTASDYWHVYWSESDRTNIQYRIENNGGSNYSATTSISDWRTSQSHVDFVPWDSSTYPRPFLDIVIESLPNDSWGYAVTSPSYTVTSDATLNWATANINTRTIENSISNGTSSSVRQKVITHEIGHTLGLAHPSDSGRVSIMQQGWNGYSTVQPSDVTWINNRYTNSNLSALSSTDVTSDSQVLENVTDYSQNSTADWIEYEDLEDLVESSDVVLKGYVVSNATTEVGSREDLYTISSFLVDEVFKGENIETNDTISIGDLGGETSPLEEDNTVNNKLMTRNSEFYVFLDQVNPEEYRFEIPFDYFPKGGPAGKVSVEENIELNTLNQESYGIDDFENQFSE